MAYMYFYYGFSRTWAWKGQALVPKSWTLQPLQTCIRGVSRQVSGRGEMCICTCTIPPPAIMAGLLRWFHWAATAAAAAAPCGWPPKGDIRLAGDAPLIICPRPPCCCNPALCAAKWGDIGPGNDWLRWKTHAHQLRFTLHIYWTYFLRVACSVNRSSTGPSRICESYLDYLA